MKILRSNSLSVTEVKVVLAQNPTPWQSVKFVEVPVLAFISTLCHQDVQWCESNKPRGQRRIDRGKEGKDEGQKRREEGTRK